MKLYAHQKEMVEKNPKVCGLWWECGTGKTLTAIRLAEQNARHILVVCPKSLVENWEREIKKFKTTDAIFSVQSKERFKKLAKAMFPVDGVIIDESHFFHGHKSQMHKAMVKFLSKQKPNCVYLLTATPLLSTPYNVYAVSALLGDSPKWQKFTNLYFNRIRMGPRLIWQPKNGWQEQMIPILKHYGDVKSMSECLDLPDKIYQREDFELTSSQKHKIKEIEVDPICVATPIVKWTKVHQICGGTLKTIDGYETCLGKKLPRVQELSKEYDKLVVVCRYNAELDMLSQHLKNAVVLNGATKNRQELLDSFESKTHGVLLVNASVSEGYNLRGVNKMVFYSLSFSLKDRVQMEGRIYGSKRGIEGKAPVYIDLVARGTIDEDVYNCIQTKNDFQIELYSDSTGT
jgi:superfamily II DNA or RNA helicase